MEQAYEIDKDDSKLIPTNDGYGKEDTQADDEYWEGDSNNPILVTDNPTHKSVSTLFQQKQLLIFPLKNTRI